MSSNSVKRKTEKLESEEKRRKMEDMMTRWKYLSNLTEQQGPSSPPDFEPTPEILQFLQRVCRVLVIGAGGLGCELLKDLAMMGFGVIDVIDMDTIGISNLNRQFLFRKTDVGKPKADVAAVFINKRVDGCTVTPHYKRIEDYDENFYRQFHLIICGLDSIVARRWINGMVMNLLQYENGELDQSSIIPIIDGGTEGFKGNARVILPGMTACIECNLDLFPPQINFPMCTIAHTPRLPEHCIEYVRIFLWPQQHPFGEDVVINGDDPDHISWICEESQKRAQQFGIVGINYRLTQGVVKRIIPAVASTNAAIAAVCALETFKIASRCCRPLNNYVNFSDTDGIYTYPFEAERRENCPACSGRPLPISFLQTAKLQDVVDFLIASPSHQLRSPGLTTIINGSNKTLYMSTVRSIEVATKPNLKKTLKDLELQNGQNIYVADPTSPNTLTFQLNLTQEMD